MQEQIQRVTVRRTLQKSAPDFPEFKTVELRKCGTPLGATVHDTDEILENYWRPNIKPHHHFDLGHESLTVLMLGERRVRGHLYINFGSVKIWRPFSKRIISAAIGCRADEIAIAHFVPGGRPKPRPEHHLFYDSLCMAADSVGIAIFDYLILAVFGSKSIYRSASAQSR